MGYAGGKTGDGGSGGLLPRAAPSRWLAWFGNSPRAYSCTCKFELGSVKALRGPMTCYAGQAPLVSFTGRGSHPHRTYSDKTGPYVPIAPTHSPYAFIS